MDPVKSKSLVLLKTVPVILLLDIVTKRWALTALANGEDMELLGGLLPLTLALNRGAAFGIEIGQNPRWLFIPIVLIALALLAMLLREADDQDRSRILSIALITGGALGNLIDRIRWDLGVVDFIGPIDLPFTEWNWPIFNVADMAISCGAVLLAISFWREERRLRAEDAADSDEPGSPVSPADPSSGEASV